MQKNPFRYKAHLSPMRMPSVPYCFAPLSYSSDFNHHVRVSWKLGCSWLMQTRLVGSQELSGT